MTRRFRRVRIRRARLADMDELASLHHAQFHLAFAGIIGAEALAPRTAEYFRRRFVRHVPRISVAWLPRQMAGFSLVRRGYLQMLFVRPGLQSRGVGRALLRNAERRGARTLDCFAVNLRARAFYRREGWRLIRRFRLSFAGDRHNAVFFAALRRTAER
jgi:putative acetyltransferase